MVGEQQHGSGIAPVRSQTVDVCGLPAADHGVRMVEMVRPGPGDAVDREAPEGGRVMVLGVGMTTPRATALKSCRSFQSVTAPCAASAVRFTGMTLGMVRRVWSGPRPGDLPCPS